MEGESEKNQWINILKKLPFWGIALITFFGIWQIVGKELYERYFPDGIFREPPIIVTPKELSLSRAFGEHKKPFSVQNTSGDPYYNIQIAVITEELEIGSEDLDFTWSWKPNKKYQLDLDGVELNYEVNIITNLLYKPGEENKRATAIILAELTPKETKSFIAIFKSKLGTDGQKKPWVTCPIKVLEYSKEAEIPIMALRKPKVALHIEINPDELMIFDFCGQRVTVFLKSSFWFFADEVCGILNIDNISQAIQSLPPIEKSTASIVSSDGKKFDGKKAIINEPGLNKLIKKSQLPKAKDFQKWIYTYVFPKIRKRTK
ncbi:MAG: BRO family protein [Pseudomonadota bacterium]